MTHRPGMYTQRSFYLAGSPRGGSPSAQNKFIMGAIQRISESAYYFIQHYSMLLPRPIGRHDENKHMSFQTQINHYWLIRIAERHFYPVVSGSAFSRTLHPIATDHPQRGHLEAPCDFWIMIPVVVNHVIGFAVAPWVNNNDFISKTSEKWAYDNKQRWFIGLGLDVGCCWQQISTETI